MQELIKQNQGHDGLEQNRIDNAMDQLFDQAYIMEFES